MPKARLSRVINRQVVRNLKDEHEQKYRQVKFFIFHPEGGNTLFTVVQADKDDADVFLSSP
jgi:hypothetical protein